MRSQNAPRDHSQDAFAPGKTDEEYEKELSQEDEEQEDKHDDDDEDINTKDGNTDEDEDEDEDDSEERKGLRHLYLHYIKWYRVLRTDPVHKKVMKTLREFIEDDDMDYMEAGEAAINKRKYFLNRLFVQDDLPKDTSNEDENLTYSAKKRKYYEAIHTM